jgi:hypothetical protein
MARTKKTAARIVPTAATEDTRSIIEKERTGLFWRRVASAVMGYWENYDREDMKIAKYEAIAFIECAYTLGAIDYRLRHLVINGLQSAKTHRTQEEDEQAITYLHSLVMICARHGCSSLEQLVRINGVDRLTADLFGKETWGPWL